MQIAIETVQASLARKFQRQRQIEALSLDAGGYCSHVGNISPACHQCFSNKFSINFIVGIECNLDCIYCLSHRKDAGFLNGFSYEEYFQKQIAMAAQCSESPDYQPFAYAFSGGGEPLLYMPRILETMTFLKAIEKRTGKKPWYYIYTNGVLAGKELLCQLSEIGIDEIRFHLGASNFSESVYRNIETATRILHTVTVETPAWQPHREKLFAMLPILNGLGVKHLNLGEIEINSRQVLQQIIERYPETKFYYLHGLHIESSELVYDLIEETIKNNYTFSVLDCSGLVKLMQRAHHRKLKLEIFETLRE